MTTRDDRDWSPLEPDEHARQIDALRRYVRAHSVETAIELGAGDGRVATRLAACGVRILAIDRDEEGLRACASGGCRVRRADFLDPCADLTLDGAPVDCALCLGNTIMEVADVDAAAALFTRLHDALRPGGHVVIDNVCARYWPCVSDGMWISGVSPDRTEQIVWRGDDNVFALRRADAVDPLDCNVRETDRLVRLWTMGQLRLLALASGWRGPEPDETGELLVFHRPSR